MRAVKAVVFLAVTLALVISLAPQLSAQYEEDPNPGGGSGGSSWTVTCVYDGQERLISKTCVSGGSHACNCP